jgi:hypothetical protein
VRRGLRVRPVPGPYAEPADVVGRHAAGLALEQFAFELALEVAFHRQEAPRVDA